MRSHCISEWTDFTVFSCVLNRGDTRYWYIDISHIIDLSKAFDTVNHDVLLHKLLSFGICDKTFLVHLSRRLKCTVVIIHCPSSVRLSSVVNFHILDFSSETAEQNSMKLDRKQDLNILYHFCVFRADQKNKMAAPSSDWLRHFWLLLWDRWREFEETWQEARSQCALPSLCFSGRSENQDGRPWPLIGWDIFDFSSETTEPNWKKLDRKQDLKVLYQVCVFQADWKNKMAALASDLLRHFYFSSETAERNFMKLDRKQDLHVLYQVCVFQADRKTKMAALTSDWLATHTLRHLII